MIWRYFPPKGCGTDAPGTFAIWLRTVNWPRSCNSVSFSPSPFNVIRQTGRLDASNFSTTGGSVPGGKSPQLRHRQIGNAADGRIRIGARLKINLDKADAGQRTRFDVVDATPQREKSSRRGR